MLVGMSRARWQTGGPHPPQVPEAGSTQGWAGGSHNRGQNSDLRQFDREVRHQLALKRPRMTEARFRSLSRRTLGSFGAGEVLEVLQELGRARAVEREGRRG